jgi:ferrous iron transport protein A
MMSFNKGDKFIVKGFSDCCPGAFKDKIISMGIIDGQEMIVASKSVFGGPIAFNTKCGMISLRKKDITFLKLEKHN